MNVDEIPDVCKNCGKLVEKCKVLMIASFNPWVRQLKPEKIMDGYEFR